VAVPSYQFDEKNYQCFQLKMFAATGPFNHEARRKTYAWLA